jgi:S1-C subfamily serine protease
MAESEISREQAEVCDSWQQMVQALLAIVLLIGVAAMLHNFVSVSEPVAEPDQLQKQVVQLTHQVEELQREQEMPALVLSRYRNSIGYISGVYQIGFANEPAAIRARVSGTGFLVGEGLLATNRHVAQPWYGDSEAEALLARGAKAMVENLVIFFPGSPTAVELIPGTVSSADDLAVLKIPDKNAVRGIPILPLAKKSASPGEVVTVVGYPMGITGMVAKSPNRIYERLALRRSDLTAASELAALSLIRPSTTCGHLGDVVGKKLIYDAPTAHGGSGGPVFNSDAEVIGVNSAYLDGFSGGTLGVSVEALRPLIEAAQKNSQ